MQGITLDSKDFKIKDNGVYVTSNNNKPGLLLIHAEWCGHCKRFKPTFNKIASQLGKDFPCMSIEDSDMTDTLKSSLQFGGYPTIKFFDQRGKIISDYNGDRSESDILTHICQVYHHCMKFH